MTGLDCESITCGPAVYFTEYGLNSLKIMGINIQLCKMNKLQSCALYIVPIVNKTIRCKENYFLCPLEYEYKFSYQRQLQIKFRWLQSMRSFPESFFVLHSDSLVNQAFLQDQTNFTWRQWEKSIKLSDKLQLLRRISFEYRHPFLPGQGP